MGFIIAFLECSLEDSRASSGLSHVCSGFGREGIGAGYLSFLFVGWMVRSQCEKTCSGEIINSSYFVVEPLSNGSKIH